VHSCRDEQYGFHSVLLLEVRNSYHFNMVAAQSFSQASAVEHLRMFLLDDIEIALQSRVGVGVAIREVDLVAAMLKLIIEG